MDREARKKQTITAFNEWFNEEDPSRRYAMVESMWHSTPGKWLQTQRPEWSHDHDYRLRIPLGYRWNGSDKGFHCFVSEKDGLFASIPFHKKWFDRRAEFPLYKPMEVKIPIPPTDCESAPFLPYIPQGYLFVGFRPVETKESYVFFRGTCGSQVAVWSTEQNSIAPVIVVRKIEPEKPKTISAESVRIVAGWFSSDLDGTIRWHEQEPVCGNAYWYARHGKNEIFSIHSFNLSLPDLDQDWTKNKWKVE